MRIIAGALKGRKLVGPKGEATRPMTDRIREATFNSLETLGLIEEASVADLFAGTGSIGIEAISRGAKSAVFVENDKEALTALKKNVSALGLSNAKVVESEVMRFLQSAPHFDLVFADPPYAYANWPKLLKAIQADHVVYRSQGKVPVLDGWEALRIKPYSGSIVTIAQVAN